MIDIEAIRKRTEAATPGDWTDGLVAELHGQDAFIRGICERLRERDAIFIAHARTDVPALCDEVERLREALGGVLANVQECGMCPVSGQTCVLCFARAVLEGRT